MDLEEAHTHSIADRAEILASEPGGCSDGGRSFAPEQFRLRFTVSHTEDREESASLELFDARNTGPRLRDESHSAVEDFRRALNGRPS